MKKLALVLGMIVGATLSYATTNEVPVYRNGPNRPPAYPRLADCSDGGIGWNATTGAFACNSTFASSSAPPVNCVGTTDALQYDAGTSAFQCKTISVPATPVNCVGSLASLQYDAGTSAYQCVNHAAAATPVNCVGVTDALQWDAGASAYQCATISVPAAPGTCTGTDSALQYSGGYSCADMTSISALMRRPHRRFQYCAVPTAVGSTTITGLGNISTLIGSPTTAGVSNDNYLAVSIPTGAGGIGGMQGGLTFRGGMNPRFTAVLNPVQITNVRRWVGFAASSITGSATPSVAMMAFRFDTGVPDTNWQLCSGSGSGAATCSDTGISGSSTAGVMSTFIIDCQASTCTGYIGVADNTLTQATSTRSLSGFTSTTMIPYIVGTDLTGSHTSFQFGLQCIEVDVQ